MVSLLLAHFFWRFEMDTYDQLIREYRKLPLKYSWLFRGHTGLHRCITLIGDKASGEFDSQEYFQMLRRCREHLAASSTWITEDVPEIPRDLRNGTLELSPIYVVATLPAHDTAPPRPGTPPVFALNQQTPGGVIREVYLALKSPEGLVPCLPLVLYSHFLELEECRPQAAGSWLVMGGKHIPVLEDPRGYKLALTPYISQLRRDFRFEGDTLLTAVTDSMEPLNFEKLKDPNDPNSLWFGSRAHRRFFFLGEYSLAAVGERLTALGSFRDFQIAAMALDNLIQGPLIIHVGGWPRVILYLAISAGLALWMLSPTTVLGQLVRLALVAAAINVLSQALFVAGIYVPFTWLYFYCTLLTAWRALKIWTKTMAYVQRYGGSSAAQFLLRGDSDLDHAIVEERVATIVFVGLPLHLRELEVDYDPRTLAHRQYFSERMAAIAKAEEGIVHDFQADFLMLGFGTQPSHQDPDHALRAFRAARKLVELRDQLERAWEPRSKEGARVQVSINTGLVAVGWVGTSAYKRASAAIGDTTNVAARLLGTAKKLDLDLLVSDTAYDFLKDVAAFEALEPVKLKGKTDLVAIYRLAVQS